MLWELKRTVWMRGCSFEHPKHMPKKYLQLYADGKCLSKPVCKEYNIELEECKMLAVSSSRFFI